MPSSTTAAMSRPTPSSPPLRLWILEAGLFPRRITIYLLEKGISSHFEIIPVRFTNSSLDPSPGRPPGTLPILEISRSTSDAALDGEYIFQSTAILEYLEEIYSGVGRNMLSGDPAQRAHVRDCMSILNEAVGFMNVYWRNASAAYAEIVEQDERVAEHAMGRYHSLLETLEGLVEKRGVKGPFLGGEGDAPTVVDCVLLATAQYARGAYGDDFVREYPRLKAAVEEFEKRPSGGTVDFGGLLPREIGEKGKELSIRREVKREA